MKLIRIPIEKINLLNKEINELKINLEPLRKQSQDAKKYLELKEELKEKIKSIDWNAKTMNDYKNLEKQINNSSKKYIIINGNEKYVREINKMLNKYKKNHKDADLVLINCYDIIEFNKNIGSILENTDKILNTSGEHEIEEIFPEYVREVKKKA